MLRRALIGILGAGLVLAFLIGAALPTSAGGACRGQPVTDGTGSMVEMRNLCFTPTVLHIQPGDSVTFVNRDKDPHTVSGANVVWGDYAELSFGQSVAHTFTRPGTYPYYCFLHNGMIGAIVVGDGSGPGAAGTSTGVLTRTTSSATSNGSPWITLLLLALVPLAGLTGYWVASSRRHSSHGQSSAETPN